jgi:peptidylprolyl isomerase
MKNLFLSFAVISLIGSLACGEKEQKPAEEAPSQDWSRSKPMTVTDSGLQFLDVAVGTGESPAAGDQVIIHYTALLENGKQFASSFTKGKPLSFHYRENPMIAGIEEGLETMKEGGRRRLVVPPALGYGAEGTSTGSVPPNATLTFEIILLDVVTPGEEGAAAGGEAEEGREFEVPFLPPEETPKEEDFLKEETGEKPAAGRAKTP